MSEIMRIQLKFGQGVDFAALGLDNDETWDFDVAQDSTIEDLKNVILQLCDGELRFHQLRLRRKDSSEELSEYMGADRACSSTFKPRACTFASHGVKSDSVLEVDILLSEDEKVEIRKGQVLMAASDALPAGQGDKRRSRDDSDHGDGSADDSMLGLGPPPKRNRAGAVQQGSGDPMDWEEGRGVGPGQVPAPPQEVPPPQQHHHEPEPAPDIISVDSDSDSDVEIIEPPCVTGAPGRATPTAAPPEQPGHGQLQQQPVQRAAQPPAGQARQTAALQRQQQQGTERRQPQVEQLQQQPQPAEQLQPQVPLQQQQTTARQQPQVAEGREQPMQAERPPQQEAQTPTLSPAHDRPQPVAPQRPQQQAPATEWREQPHVAGRQPGAQGPELQQPQATQRQQQTRGVVDSPPQPAQRPQHGPERQQQAQGADGPQPTQPRAPQRPQQEQQAPRRQPLPLIPTGHPQQQLPGRPQGHQAQQGHAAQGLEAHRPQPPMPQRQPQQQETAPRPGGVIHAGAYGAPAAAAAESDGGGSMDEGPGGNSRPQVQKRQPGVRAAWTVAETQALVDAMENHGKHWALLEQLTGLRDQKSLRYKWRNLVQMCKTGWVGMRGTKLPQELCDQIADLCRRLGA